MTRLMSVWTSPLVAANTAVRPPTIDMAISVVLAYSSSGETRSIRYTPAVTSVAAWMRALTGVGIGGDTRLKQEG